MSAAGTGFRARVYDVVRAIPYGMVLTYGDVAHRIGAPGAARQVGWALASLPDGPDGDDVPWWRVINHQGAVSLRVPGADQQVALLRSEGIPLTSDGRLALEYYRWEGPSTP